MPSLLRVLNNKAKWEKDRQPSWVAEGEVQADVIKDLRPVENELSVWQITDDETNLDRVLAAFAANRDTWDKIDYVLVNLSFIEQADFALENAPGDTPDEEVNRLYHLNLTNLTVTKLAELAKVLAVYGRLGRKTEKAIKRLVGTGVARGHINKGELAGSLQDKLDLTSQLE